MRSLLVAIVLIMPCATFAASTVETFEFPDEATHARYQGLVDEIRCPKCQNTNLAGSDAPIAKDLRATVYRLVVTEGRSDEEVREFLVARYGDFVLYDPPFRADTLLLWLGPLAVLVLGGFVLATFARRRGVAPITEQDRARAAELLGDENG